MPDETTEEKIDRMLVAAEDERQNAAALARQAQGYVRRWGQMKDELVAMREALSIGSRAPTLLQRAEREATAELEAEEKA